MIDKAAVVALLSTTSSKNLVGTGIELKPYELALNIVQSLDSSEEFGYVVMGVTRQINDYAIDGVGQTTFVAAREPIQKAISLISHEIEMESGNISIDGKNIFVIKTKNVDKAVSIGFIKDLDSQNVFVSNMVRA